jgi:hypothetical protein
VADFSQYFSQFPYAPSVRRFFCFSAFGRTYHLMRLAMGQTHACDLAHSTTELVLIRAQPLARGQGLAISWRAQIDNILVVGSAEALEYAGEVIRTLCASLCLTINDGGFAVVAGAGAAVPAPAPAAVGASVGAAVGAAGAVEMPDSGEAPPFAAALVAAGVKALTLGSGIAREELQSLVEVVSRAGRGDEDVVSGAALAAVCAYAVRERLLACVGDATFQTDQGHALGRPNKAQVTVRAEAGQIADIKVRGRGVVVASGEFVPATPA